MNQPLAPTPGLFTKLLSLLASVILLVVGFTFSLLFLTVVAAVGLVVWGYFWWKTRELRQAMRERPPGGHVVEGESIVVESVVVETDTAKDSPTIKYGRLE